MTIPISDHLEGNPEAQACRERYRDIVRLLGEANDSFVARFEVKLNENNLPVLLVTSSLGAQCDKDLCNLAVAMLAAMSGLRVE